MLNQSGRLFAVTPVSHKVCFLRPSTTTATSSSPVTSPTPSISSSTISTFATFILSESGTTTTTLMSLGTFNSEMAYNTAHFASSVTCWTLLGSTEMSLLIATKALLSFPRACVSIQLVTNCIHLVSTVLFQLVINSFLQPCNP